MFFKNLLSSSLIISSTFLLINSVPILANSSQKQNLESRESINSIQNQEKNAKTELQITKIEFSKPNSLTNSWDKIQQILDKNDEVSLTFNNQLELSNLSFNLPIQIIKGDNLETIINKSNEIKNSVLDSLIKQKSEEKDFLNQQVWDTDDQNITNLQEQMTILTNLDLGELANLKTQNYNYQNLFAKSLTITTNNQNLQNDKNLKKISDENSIKIEEIDLTNADKSDKRDQDLKSKIILKSNKIVQKTNKLNEIQFENAKLSESNSTPSSEIQSSFSSSSLATKPEPTLSSLSSLSSSSSEVSASQIVPKIKDLLEISENYSNNSNQNPILITENLIQESNLESGLENNSKDDKISQNSQKISKITKFRYKNPFFISQEEENKRNQEIELEKEKALAHNRQFKQYYSQDDYQKMVDSNTLPDPKIYPYAIVDENGREIDKKQLETKNKTGWLDSILKIGSVETAARGLNNSVVPLLIYSWTNPNLTLDLPNGNMNNGTQFGLYGRHGGWNQTFMFDNNTNQIRMNGKCLEVSAGNFNNGTRIQIWDCHGGSNQKWYFDGLRLKPLYNQNFCLEQNAGVTEGTRINLWSCNSNNNQVWVAGRNDFGYTNYSVEINASTFQNIITQDVGHAFVAFRGNGFLVNTFSSWGYASNDDYNSDNTSRLNNIADGDNVWVDSGTDWFYGNNPTVNGFKSFNLFISKQVADVYRFNSGYRWPYGNTTMEYQLFPFGIHEVNCAKYSSRLWNYIMQSGGYFNRVPNETFFPSDIYNAI